MAPSTRQIRAALHRNGIEPQGRSQGRQTGADCERRSDSRGEAFALRAELLRLRRRSAGVLTSRCALGTTARRPAATGRWAVCCRRGLHPRGRAQRCPATPKPWGSSYDSLTTGCGPTPTPGVPTRCTAPTTGSLITSSSPLEDPSMIDLDLAGAAAETTSCARRNGRLQQAVRGSRGRSKRPSWRGTGIAPDVRWRDSSPSPPTYG